MVNQTIPVHGISKLWLEVRQLGRAIHFYRDMLRLPLVGLDGDSACFDVDGQQIAQTGPQVVADGSVAGALCHWALAVEEAESDWYARKVRESGGGIYPIPWGHYIDDPDGNLGELMNGSGWPHARPGTRWGEEISPAAAIVEVCLLMTNQAQALHFYRDRLGLATPDGVAETGEPFLRMRLPGGQDLLLWWPGIYMGVARAGRTMCLTIACASLSAVAEFWDRQAVTSTHQNERLYIRDPFGHTFAVDEVATWPLPPSDDPTRWSFPKRRTDALRWDQG
jgi:catechol 2,3-dioxygenase-like lactoylglutathione lyase family enzyme